MPAGVMHARIAGPSPALARMMHGRLTQLKYRYGIPHLAVHPTGVQLPADQSEHVDAGDVVTDLGAVARATAMGTQQPASTHPACASSHCCNGKATDSQARSHPCALASPAELPTAQRPLAYPAIPFVSRRQSRHRWPVLGLLFVWNHGLQQPSIEAGVLRCPAEKKETHHEADAD